MPSLGIQDQESLSTHSWEVHVSYQYGSSNEFFVGTRRLDSAGPFGRSPKRSTNIFDVGVRYAVSSRWSAALSVPYVESSGGVEQGTAASHRFVRQGSSGLGDISLEASFALPSPQRARRGSGTIGFGFRAPTGSDSQSALNYNRNPPAEARLDEAFQPGSGGWYALVTGQGVVRISDQFFGYGSAYYGLSLEEHSDVVQGGTFRGVPDVYSARLGAAFKPRGSKLAVTAGGRINGITVRDLIGGGDLYFRRPGYEIYAEAGVSWSAPRYSVSLEVPVRIAQNKLDSLLDESLGQHFGADFAPYLVILTYSRRF